MPNIEISARTREALGRLFNIMDIEDSTFDARLFELASQAFAAQASAPDAMIKRARTKQPRKKIELKQTTVDELRSMHSRLFPWLPWQSWNWYMEQVLNLLEDQVHEKKDSEMDVYKERED